MRGGRRNEQKNPKRTRKVRGGRLIVSNLFIVCRFFFVFLSFYCWSTIRLLNICAHLFASFASIGPHPPTLPAAANEERSSQNGGASLLRLGGHFGSHRVPWRSEVKCWPNQRPRQPAPFAVHDACALDGLTMPHRCNRGHTDSVAGEN